MIRGLEPEEVAVVIGPSRAPWRRYARLALLTAACQVIGVSQAAPSPEPVPGQSAASAAEDDISAQAPSTLQELRAKFEAINPGARLHLLDMAMNAYAEGSTPAGLKLSRLWVGPNGTLVELIGLPVDGRGQSAVIRRETFVLRDQAGAKALLAQEGVTVLTDRRGGSALVVKPGETLLALFEPVDDRRPMRLEHTGPDGRTFIYFDAIDPRFRERYDAALAKAQSPAATPEQLKDFLVEFARNDPDGKAQEIFLKLIQAMRAKNSFEGYYNAYLLIQQPEDARKAWQLARTDEHRMLMENMAVATLADKNRLFDFDLRMDSTNTSQREGGCWMFCRYNFTASRPLRGQVQVSMKANSPIRLKLGTYKVLLDARVEMPRRKLRESSWLGHYDGPDDIRFSREISLTVGPPNYSTNAPVSLGDLNVAFFQRGSAGGYEGAWATGDARIQLSIKSVEFKP